MQQWWDNLALREKQILVIGSLLLGLFLLYRLIVSPLHQGLTNLRATVQADQQLLSWMQTTATKINSLQGGSVAANSLSPEALLTTTDQAIRSSAVGAQLSSIQQNNNNSIEVKFAQVSFDSLTDCLVSLRQQHGIQVKQISINRLNEAGMVQADLILIST